MIFCPWTQIAPETREFLDNCGPLVHYEYVGNDSLSYGRLIHKLWASKRAVIIIEHDVLPDKQAFLEMLDCDGDYCAIPYPWTTNIGPALGCTRFTADFRKTYSDAADIAASTTWNQMDYMLMRVSLLRKHGQAPHLHLPPAQHLNPAQALVPPWDSWTVEEHLVSLGWRIDEGGRTATFVGGGGFS